MTCGYSPTFFVQQNKSGLAPSHITDLIPLRLVQITLCDLALNYFEIFLNASLTLHLVTVVLVWQLDPHVGNSLPIIIRKLF